MTNRKILEKLKLPNVLILLSIIFLSCALLIVTNYFTIKILSASRAYINGESHYSKGQKDAVRHLITFLYTEDKKQWALYERELSVPKGDGKARIALLQHDDVKAAREGFRAGRNQEQDLNDMIWVFRNFQSVPFFRKALIEWEKGDAIIEQIDTLAAEIYQRVKQSNPDAETKRQYLSKISSLSEQLTVNERNFSNTLGEGTREIKGYLIFTNVVFIMLIISSVFIHFYSMMKKLILSKNEIEQKNNDLLLVNKELDKFVYSVSHDLRSPITSMKGLVEILKEEDDPEQSKAYLKMMTQTLDKQDNFIRDIIDYSKNARTKVTLETVDLTLLLDDIISQLQYMENAGAITFNRAINTASLHTDSFRLKIILSNLLSNAIKYADLSKAKPFISVKAYDKEHSHIIEIEDNGIGIEEKYLSRIFDMFFVTNNDNKGTGLGLYIVKDAITNLNGSINVVSEPGKGTLFTIILARHSLQSV